MRILHCLAVTCHHASVTPVGKSHLRALLQVSDVIDMKQDEMNPTFLTVVLSEERGHVYQFQTFHDLAVFRLNASP